MKYICQKHSYSKHKAIFHIQYFLQKQLKSDAEEMAFFAIQFLCN